MRTWLFVPGHDARKSAKALQSAADVIIFDWEDAVPEDRKAEARQTVRATLLAADRPTPRRVVRINHAGHPGFVEDVAALEGLPISGVMLPKVAGPDDVRRLAAHTPHPIIPLLESARGIESALHIAEAHAQVERLAYGALDFVADLGGQWTPSGEASHYARARIAVAGRAAGLAGPVDSVYPLLDDAEGLRRDAVAARVLGFAGKTLLHPNQIAIALEVFAPTADEIREATTVLTAFAEARARGESVVRLPDGRFVDPPVVRWAEQVLGPDRHL
ncbi:MAG TPA: CoA ester lyase [Chloroflexia bacterium]|nr:CoA ester lyase [Chloroflexia bacterium]